MKNFYIPHKLQVGDITRLSDRDSILAISQNIKIEDLLGISTPSGRFIAQVVDIFKNSVEVEVIKIEEENTQTESGIKVIQSISHISKFVYFLEKITEIGVDEIIPIYSQYTIPSSNQIKKDFNLWNKVVKDASIQSRNINPPIINRPVLLKNYNFNNIGRSKFCFATENVKTKSIRDVEIKSNDITLAFGPESGWGIEDIAIFKNHNFEFIKLEGNILRTETSPIVATSIIKFILNEL